MTMMKALLLASAVGLAACRGRGAEGDIVIDTIGGVPSVMNPAHGIISDSLPWTLSRYILVTAERVYESEPVLDASDVAILPNGNVMVLDASNQRVLRFDSSGAYLGRFGRRGEAAGEFMAPLFLEAADSEVFVFDIGLRPRRVTAFDSSGVFLRRFNIDLQGLVSTSLLFHAGGPDELYLAGEPAPFGGARDTGAVVVLRLSGSGGIADTIASHAPPAWTRVPRVGGRSSFIKTRFAPEPRLAAIPGLVAVATGARYLVELRRPDGSALRRIGRAYTHSEVTAAIRDSVLDRLVEHQFTREELSELSFAAVIPAIEGLALDERGRLWVDPYVPDAPQRCDIYDEEGRYLGALHLPLAMRVEDLEGDRMCAVIAQPVGGNAVACFRIAGRR
jgi:hypothetical protein